MHADQDDLPAALARDLNGGFERVAVAYQHRLYAFALRYCGRPADAEEVAQDALVRAYRALVTYEPERIRALSLRPWLFQITINVARNRSRGRRAEQVSLEETMQARDWEPTDDADAQPEAVAERTERQRELEAGLLALPERFRAAVIMRHVQDLSYSEIALILRQPVGTVKANVHRGVRILREAVSRQLSEVR